MKNLFSILLSFTFFFTIQAQNLTEWEHTNGPEGSTAASILSNSDFAFVGGHHRLYRSGDGMTWETLNIERGFPIAIHEETLVMQSSNVTAEGFFPPRHLLISHDHGITWEERAIPPAIEYVTEIFVASHGIYLLNEVPLIDVLLHSDDDGFTWTEFALPVSISGSFFPKTFDDWLYIRTSNTLQRTNDGGNSWQDVTPPLGVNESVGRFISNGDHLFVEYTNGFYYSHDNGQTWNSMNISAGWDFEEIYTDNGNIFLVNNNGQIYGSDDFGVSFSIWHTPNQEYTFLRYTAFQDAILLSSYNKGVYRWDSSNGINSLTAINNGLQSASIYDLATAGEYVWTASGVGVFRYHDNEETWSSSLLPLPEHQYSYVEANEAGVVVAQSSYEDGFYLSTDYGDTWQTLPLPGNSFFEERLQLVGNSLFWCCGDFGDELVVSNDNGQNWIAISEGIFNEKIVEFNDEFYSIAQDRLIKSNDGGLTWEEVVSFPDIGFGWASEILAAGDFLFINFAIYPNSVTSGFTKMYKSEDGLNWTYSNDGFTYANGSPEESEIFYAQGDYYMQLDGRGFYTSVNQAETWIPVVPMRFEKFTFKEDWVYSGGFSGGVIRFAPPKPFGSVISGKVFWDENQNGVFDSNEPTLSEVPIYVESNSLWSSGYASITNQVGDYSLGVFSDAADTLRPFLNNFYVEEINPPFYLTNNSGTGKDFALQLTTDVTDVATYGSFVEATRPGFDSKIHLRYANVGTQVANGKISAKLDANLTYLSAEPAPTEIIGDSLVWDFTNLGIFGHANIFIDCYLPADVSLGTELLCNIRAFTDLPDNNLNNNYYPFTGIVVGSFDPNDKRVSPEIGLTAEEIAAGKELFFTIRFQNTGTFHAEKVRITDQLDTALFHPSLRLVASSHDVTSFELQPSGLLEVVYEDIFLPDSTSNEPESHGYVTFAIQRNRDFADNDEITNSASIFFDFNAPIFTNEVSFGLAPTITSTSFIEPKEKQSSILIFPNPAQNQFLVDSKNLISGSGKMLLLDYSGRVVLEKEVNELADVFQVQLPEISNGAYWVSLENETGNVGGKLIVQR